jgi:hypothetical protein
MTTAVQVIASTIEGSASQAPRSMGKRRFRYLARSWLATMARLGHAGLRKSCAQRAGGLSLEAD